MYAEERQQAIADLVTQRGRLSVNQLAREYDVTTETVRRDLSALERTRAGPPGARRRRSRRARSPLIESGHPRARPGQHRDRRSGSPAPPLDLLPPAGGTILLDAGSHDRAARRSCSPATASSRSSPTPSRSPPGWPASPSIDLHLLPGRVRPTTQAAVGADTVEALVRPARRRRLPRHQRHHRRPRAHHPRPRRGRRQARDRRRAPAGSWCSPTPPSSASRPPVRFAGPRRRSTCVVTDDGVARRATAEALDAAPASRSSDRMIVTLTANPSHDRTVNLAGAARARRRPARRVGDLAGRRQGREHLPRLRRRRPAHDRRAARPPRTTRSCSSCSRAGIDCRPVQPRGRPPGQHHHHRARRHHHQAQQPRRRRRRPRCLERARRRRSYAAPTAPTGSCSPARCRPARPPEWYAELVAALRGAGARVAVDTSDAPLKALVDAPAEQPHPT